jgi:hypothetical protein
MSTTFLSLNEIDRKNIIDIVKTEIFLSARLKNTKNI